MYDIVTGMIRKCLDGSQLIGLANRPVLFMDTIQGSFRSIVTYGTLTGGETISIAVEELFQFIHQLCSLSHLFSLVQKVFSESVTCSTRRL